MLCHRGTLLSHMDWTRKKRVEYFWSHSKSLAPCRICTPIFSQSAFSHQHTLLMFMNGLCRGEFSLQCCKVPAADLSCSCLSVSLYTSSLLKRHHSHALLGSSVIRLLFCCWISCLTFTDGLSVTCLSYGEEKVFLLILPFIWNIFKPEQLNKVLIQLLCLISCLYN